ncbi:MAG: PDZ domain-containing protein [Gemmataceae bacterium]
MRLLTFVCLALCTPALLAQPDVTDTKLIAQPAVGKDHIAFAYADDLWVADLDGSNVRRLTSDIGVEMNPVFSPDGQTIAFSGQYDGNLDVYTIPVSGGTPKRLTTHPGPDVVRGWTPDGQAVLFSSPREVFTNRYSQLFTVPTGGGQPTKLPIPNGVEASYNGDGTRIAYTPIGDRSQQWKHYRGGTASRVWLYTFADHAVEPIPQPTGRCNDTDPRWQNGTVYFRSDRAGEFNLFAYDTKTKTVQQLTKFTDFPVISLAVGGGNLVFEQAGRLHRFDLGTGESNPLKIGVAADLPETRARFVKGAKYVRSASISPSGARAVFEFRGEVVTVPAEKGDPRNLTNSPGVHDRDPAWSPDGKSVAYVSDEGGEYKLRVRPADGKGTAKAYDLGGSGFYERLTWAPDSKKLAYVDNAQTLAFIDLETRAVTKVAQEPIYSPARTLRPMWSPDSKWIAYALGNRSAYRTVSVYSLADKKASPVTDGLSDASEPAFDASGKYLVFFASTDAGPVNTWFSQAAADMRARRSIYIAVLKAGEPSPLARESDEEKGTGDAKDEKKDDKPKEKKATDVVIDFAGLDQRILALPLPASGYSNLQTGTAGQFFFLKSSDGIADDGPPGGELHRYDLTKRKDETIVPKAITYQLTPDGKKALVASAGGPGGPMGPPTADWAIIDTAAPATPGKGKLNVEAVEVKVEPRAEWAQIFDEAWRVNRDYFYATNYHGADWPAMKAKYAAFLPHCTSSDDVYKVVRWMLSELAVGHSYTMPAERPFEKKTVPGGLLGADYEVANGRYRFAKVYGGLNWSPEARSPLTVPGVNVKAGEYLLAVRGTDLKPPTEVYSLFENTAGKSIEITVGPNADGTDSRTVTVEPIANEGALRNRAWVEGNLKKVHEATDGRVAYVYVPNTAGPGHTYFKRYFYPQSDKDAIIVDERFNGGGSVADYYIDHLRRPFVGMWTTRYGADFKTPQAAIHGPKVMLIDETAGSGGDLLPWMFHKEKLGPLVGKRTWGGLVGILGFPTLMDGGRVTAPDLAFWTPEKGYTVENEGVPPDVEVEQWPAAVIAGKDPQLEKAIEIALAELKKSPPAKPTRPAFPTTAKP